MVQNFFFLSSFFLSSSFNPPIIGRIFPLKAENIRNENRGEGHFGVMSIGIKCPKMNVYNRTTMRNHTTKIET